MVNDNKNSRVQEFRMEIDAVACLWRSFSLNEHSASVDQAMRTLHELSRATDEDLAAKIGDWRKQYMFDLRGLATDCWKHESTKFAPMDTTSDTFNSNVALELVRAEEIRDLVRLTTSRFEKIAAKHTVDEAVNTQQSVFATALALMRIELGLLSAIAMRLHDAASDLKAIVTEKISRLSEHLVGMCNRLEATHPQATESVGDIPPI